MNRVHQISTEALEGCTCINAVALRVQKVCISVCSGIALQKILSQAALRHTSGVRIGCGPLPQSVSILDLYWKCKEFYLGFFCTRCPKTVALRITAQNLSLRAYTACDNNMDLFRWEA